MVQLLFPSNVRINVPAGDRIEMFPPTEGSTKNVVYSIGKDDDSKVNFVLREAAIKAYPNSFFAMQLTRALDFPSGVSMKDDDDEISVRLDQNDALYFPIVFAYLNSGFTSTANSDILSTGLGTTDAKAVIELTHEYFHIKPNHATIVHHMKLQHDFNSQRVTLRASGMLGEHQLIQTVIARLDSNGIIHAAGGDTEVQINLQKVPIAAPWPRSLVGNKVMEMLIGGRQYARKTEAEQNTSSAGEIIPGDDLGPVIECDELGPVPDDDDDLQPYPYPVDMKKSFFIPAAAIHYIGVETKDRRKPFICEGMVDGRHIRVDALDCRNHAWFWLEIDVHID